MPNPTRGITLALTTLLFTAGASLAAPKAAAAQPGPNEATPTSSSARPTPQIPPAVDPSLFDGMRYRMVGPFRGGRVTAVAGHPAHPHTFYHGVTGGGLWRTDDAGHHWFPMADDDLTVGNIGAIQVAEADPDIIYVGTGSACIRGNVSVGRGVWKSVDGGETWTFIGLPESGAIGSMAVHPRDPDLVYVAALGHPFGKNPDRGVYRSRDGGSTWEHVLFLNDSTGAVSLAMNPANPQIIYAGMWRAERKPWTLISGGPESGLYKTTDGGDTWTKLDGGLPQGIVGKVTASVSRSNPNRVWAMMEAEPGNGLYRSDDGGETWTLLTNESRLTSRAWYYHHVVADPVDEDRVYVLNVGFYRSTDGGHTFQRIPVHHGDVHDLWINPSNPEIFVVGDDGGAEVTLNGGRTFSGVYNQPTAELYDVMVDNGHPYRIYGSQQDNTTISVLVHRMGNTLRPQEEWRYAAGCETGPITFDPDDPDVIWGGCYGGVINRMVVSKDSRRNVNLYPENQSRAPKDLRNRFQWVSPIVVDPHDPSTVYHASQYVHRTRDGGMTWETISPDLTTNTPEHQEYPGIPIHADHSGVEVFNTIFALAPSPHERGTIWVGSDDGRVHISQDDGASWQEITPPGMPRFGTVNRIDVSPHAPGRAFLAVHRYRENDWRPYVFRTDDYGRSWHLLTDGANGIPADHWVRVVREDEAVQGLLYAGTEFGIFVSFDDGARWQPLRMNLPATPITDMKVHRGDLVVATQGRSFWVLDDLTPLRELALQLGKEPASRVGNVTAASEEEPAFGAGNAAARVRLFTPRDAARGRAALPLSEMDLNQPDPLPDGVLLSYALGGAVEDLTLEVLDAEGRVAARWQAPRPDGAQATGTVSSQAGGGGRPLPSQHGFHRVPWGLRYLETGGVKAPPGVYTARMTWNGGSSQKTFRVLPDPRDTDLTQDDYDEQFRVTMAVQDTTGALRAALDRLRDVRRQADEIVQRAREEGRPVGSLPDLADSLAAKLVPMEAKLTSMDEPSTPTGDRRPQGAGLDREYGTLFYYLNSGGGYGGGSTEGRPTAGALERKEDLDRMWSRVRADLEALLDREVEAFNAEGARLGLGEMVLR